MVIIRPNLRRKYNSNYFKSRSNFDTNLVRYVLFKTFNKVLKHEFKQLRKVIKYSVFGILKSFLVMRQIVSINGHLGHKVSSWNSQTRLFIWGERSNYHILSLSLSISSIRSVLSHINFLLNLRKKLLFISENIYIDYYLKKIIASSQQSISCNRWLGGLLSNYRLVYGALRSTKSRQKYINILKKKFLSFFQAKNRDSAEFVLSSKQKYFKLLNRFEDVSSGFLRTLTSIPKFVIVLDGVKSKWAANELRVVGIPNAICIDSVSSLNYFTSHYLIPINTSSFAVQTLLCSFFKFNILVSYIKICLVFKIILLKKNDYYLTASRRYKLFYSYIEYFKRLKIDLSLLDRQANPFVKSKRYKKIVLQFFLKV